MNTRQVTKCRILQVKPTNDTEQIDLTYRVAAPGTTPSPPPHTLLTQDIDPCSTSCCQVSFGSSKGSMVETLIYESPVQEEPEVSPTPDPADPDSTSQHIVFIRADGFVNPRIMELEIALSEMRACVFLYLRDVGVDQALLSTTIGPISDRHAPFTSNCDPHTQVPDVCETEPSSTSVIGSDISSLNNAGES
ncbi:hypothetical protein J6590_047264 [Homalodisca vitripennis]|nr:hypothetical protein J6590_047264 [Homalodisca vitripennis]